MRHVLETSRLRLISMGPEFLRASLSDDRKAAEEIVAARLPQNWPDRRDILEMRLGQLDNDPELEPWLTRAIVLEDERCVVGISGFHGSPGGDWLREFAPKGLEFGYTVFEGYRRRGFACETGLALMDWAANEHAVTQFVLSMSPLNEASAGVAAKLGFERVGEWQHEKRGLEHVYRKTTALAERKRREPRDGRDRPDRRSACRDSESS